MKYPIRHLKPDKLTFASEMGSYFIEKIDNIQAKLDNMASGLSSFFTIQQQLFTPMQHNGPFFTAV